MDEGLWFCLHLVNLAYLRVLVLAFSVEYFGAEDSQFKKEDQWNSHEQLGKWIGRRKKCGHHNGHNNPIFTFGGEEVWGSNARSG